MKKLITTILIAIILTISNTTFADQQLVTKYILRKNTFNINMQFNEETVELQHAENTYNITIYTAPDRGEYAGTIKNTLKRVPSVFYQYLDELEYYILNFECSTNANGRIHYKNNSIYFFNKASSFTILHETIHRIDYQLNLISEKTKYKKAIIDDNKWLRNYSKTNYREDFADSFAFYLWINNKDVFKLNFPARYEFIVNLIKGG